MFLLGVKISGCRSSTHHWLAIGLRKGVEVLREGISVKLKHEYH